MGSKLNILLGVLTRTFAIMSFPIFFLSCDEVPDLNSFTYQQQTITLDGTQKQVSATAQQSLNGGLLLTLVFGYEEAPLTILLDTFLMETTFNIARDEDNVVFLDEFNTIRSAANYGTIELTGLEIDHLLVSASFEIENTNGITKQVQFENIKFYFSINHNSLYALPDRPFTINKGTLTNSSTNETEHLYYYIYEDQSFEPNYFWNAGFFPIYNPYRSLSNIIYFTTNPPLENGQPMTYPCNSLGLYFYHNGFSLYCQNGFNFSNVSISEELGYKVYRFNVEGEVATIGNVINYVANLNMTKYAKAF